MHRSHDRTALRSSGSGIGARLLRLVTLVVATTAVLGLECEGKGPDFFEPVTFVPPPGAIVGRVTVDGAGEPGVTVTVSRGGDVVATATTDANGDYAVRNLDIGTYSVSISTIPNAQCPGPRTATVTTGGEALVDFPCTSLPTTGTVTGTVVDQDGSGIGGAQVALNGRTTTTASDGSFTFEDVSTGPKTLQATAEGHQCGTASTTVTAGQTSEVQISCTRTVPTGSQIGGGYRLDGVGSENTCATGNPFPNPGETVANPGPIEVRAEESGGQTTVTIVSNTKMAGQLNTQTGEWTGMGTEPISSNLDLWETTTGGRWQFDPSRNVIYDTNAELQFRVIDNMGTSDPADDVELCRAIVENVQYTRLGDFVPSSARYKRGVRPLLPEGTTVLGLRPVAFRYRPPWGDPAAPHVGLIAEEVARVFPQAVSLDGDGEPFGIHYDTLRGLVITEIRERAARVARTGVARLAEVLDSVR